MPLAEEARGQLEEREVRDTVVRVIAQRLSVSNSSTSWQGMNFDFTGAVLDVGNFSGAVFSDGRVLFNKARFVGAAVSFSGAKFVGARVSFDDAAFVSGRASFDSALFSSGRVSF